MTENFADHPPSIAEIKAHRTSDASAWTPRDALIELLREIDAGRVKPEALVIVWHARDEDGDFRTQFNVATPNLYVTLGLLARAMQVVVKE